MKQILMEAYKTTKKLSGIDPSKPGNLKQILVDDAAFSAYVTSLAESIENKTDRANFIILAENTRVNLLENSMFQINPYESLTLPILRVFYPKLIAKEAITVSPMDKPECVKAFIRATFTPSNSPTAYTAPVIGTDISGGPSIGTPIAAFMPVPQTAFDVLGQITGVDPVTNKLAHLERDFEITAVSTDGTHYTDVSIIPAVEGHFSSSVPGGDVLSGKVDYLAGTVAISSATNLIMWIRYQVTCSLEENRINPKVTLTVDKIRLYAKDRQISANWSINMEQDMRALFDVSIQAEIVNLLGQQVALDIDREIVNALITANTRLNPIDHVDSFTRSVPLGYIWGEKYWHENIIVKLNELSAKIYRDTNIDAGNTILVNPLDAAILEDINTFTYTGTSSLDGDLGYRTATLAGGKWKVLTSAVVAQGAMILVLKSPDELKSIYFYAPYVPAVLHPWPLGATPALTILSRYATALVRPLGISVLNIHP
jgi:hypothetical protein